MKNFKIVTGYTMEVGYEKEGKLVEDNGRENLIRPECLEQAVERFVQWCEERNYKVIYINFYEVKDVIFDKKER